MNGKIEVTYKLLCKNDVNKAINLNELLGAALKLLHTTLVRISGSGKRMGIFKNVQSENQRTKSITLDSAVVTRWNSQHEECKRVSINQLDLQQSISRMISPNGYDKALYKEHQANLSGVVPTDRNYLTYQQYGI